MAKLFEEVLGPMLLTMPMGDRNMEAMPSPLVLRRKILIKHKKLPEDGSFNSMDESSTSALVPAAPPPTPPVVDVVGDMDLSNSEKNGILFLEDQLEREWAPHFFVLANSKMYYTEVHPEENDPEEADDEDESETAQRRLKEVLHNTLDGQ